MTFQAPARPHAAPRGAERRRRTKVKRIPKRQSRRATNHGGHTCQDAATLPNDDWNLFVPRASWGRQAEVEEDRERNDTPAPAIESTNPALKPAANSSGYARQELVKGCIGLREYPATIPVIWANTTWNRVGLVRRPLKPRFRMLKDSLLVAASLHHRR